MAGFQEFIQDLQPKDNTRSYARNDQAIHIEMNTTTFKEPSYEVFQGSTNSANNLIDVDDDIMSQEFREREYQPNNNIWTVPVNHHVIHNQVNTPTLRESISTFIQEGAFLRPTDENLANSLTDSEDDEDDDVIKRELGKILNKDPGGKFQEKTVSLPACRFYRPIALFILSLFLLVIVSSVFITSLITGLHYKICINWKRENILLLTWGIILVAIFLGVYGFILIFYVTIPCRSIKNWLLSKLPTEKCEISDEEMESILPRIEENKYFQLRLAGSAGDGCGCFFGQNGNIGLSNKKTFCQDLDLNIVYDPILDSEKEFTVKDVGKGFVTVILQSNTSVLADMAIDQDVREEPLLSAKKVLNKLKTVLKEKGEVNIETIPPAQRVTKKVTNDEGKKQTIQYDYVVSLASPFPTERCGVEHNDSIKCNSYVVPKSHFGETCHQSEAAWRYSFTEYEAQLFKRHKVHHRTLIKCYIILKFNIKFFAVSRFPISDCCSKDSVSRDKRKVLQSYFLKTIFLHIAHKFDSKEIMNGNEGDYDPKDLVMELSNMISSTPEDEDTVKRLRSKLGGVLDFDSTLVLILNLYIEAIQQQKLKHYFIPEVNLLSDCAGEDLKEGIAILKNIKASRVSRALDFHDFWANRKAMQISYLGVIFTLVLLILLVGATIAMSAWLMNRDIKGKPDSC